MNTRIVCAANRNVINGHVVLGIRHYCYRMCDALEAISHSFKGNKEYSIDNYTEQGFITNKGDFLSRTEAWKVAEAAGQIIRNVGGGSAEGGTLYSENLY